MADDRFDTVRMNAWVELMRGGDRAARDELLRAVSGRLERLARKMLGRFPTVRRWAETGDVLQNSLLRLLRALDQVRPSSTRDFFGLAAEQMRRELLDLARRARASREPRDSGPDCGGASGEGFDPPAAGDDPSEMDRWAAFHDAVARLPTEEREVVGLVFYHGWTHAQAAELFQVSVRTVQRWWGNALVNLRGRLEGTA